MYEVLMNTVRTFFGSGLWRQALKLALPVVMLGLIAWSSSAFRAWFARMREAGSWQSILVSIPAGVVKLLMVLTIARLVIVAMVLQAQVFAIKHGNVTEANRSAVLMKWGYPHEQRELNVSFTTKRTWVTRQLLLRGRTKDDNTIVNDSFWKDQKARVPLIGGVRPRVINTQEEERDDSVVQKGIEEANVQVVLTANQRKLGGANYAGYQDAWKLQYLVVNRYDKPVSAHLFFPVPAKTGNFYNVQILVDGESIGGKSSASEKGVRWTMPMKPGQKSLVAISYESRGLEYLRYIPRRMTQCARCLFTAVINNIPAKEIDWCVGSMPPDQKLEEITSMPYKLTWTLDNALTSYDIGIKLPKAKQPNYHVARLLKQAPLGLVLLLMLLVVPRIIVGRAVPVTVIGLTSAAYYLLYTFMGRLADAMPNFALSFLIATGVLCGLVAFLRLKDKSSRMLSWQDTLCFVALAVFYPLGMVDIERTALWMQVLYIGLLLYACVLVVSFRVVPAFQAIVRRDSRG